MTIPFLSADQLRDVVPMEAAIGILEEAFVQRKGTAPRRERHETGAGDLLIMPAWNEAAVGVKLVTVNRSNPSRGLPLIHGVYILFDAASTSPVALIDAEELTRIRTAAVSGLAARALSSPEATRLVVFGAGPQAEGHIEAMLAVRPIEDVTVVSRTAEKTESLAERESRRSGVRVRAGSPDAVSSAEIVCTCTSSSTPVFAGSLLDEGAFVCAVGSYRPEARELDDDVMRRAGRVVVEDMEAALTEAGDIVIAREHGVLDRSRVIELADVLTGNPPMSADVTVFKSVGLALEDLAVATLAAERSGLLGSR